MSSVDLPAPQEVIDRLKMGAVVEFVSSFLAQTHVPQGHALGPIVTDCAEKAELPKQLPNLSDDQYGAVGQALGLAFGEGFMHVVNSLQDHLKRSYPNYAEESSDQAGQESSESGADDGQA